ncbi:MAG: nucleoside recognition protein [Chloroflexi bacterium]|nr:nucleoside recognition protein [Chloroflexota bacterium]
MAEVEVAAPPKKVYKESIVSVFMRGAKRGFYIGIEQIAPAMILGYAIVQFLTLTGLVDLLGSLFKPIMGVFGLPGESVIVLVSAFFAKAAGAATAANLFQQGLVNAAQATVLLVPSMLMGTLVGHFARIVLVAETNPKYHQYLLVIPVIDSILGMLAMRLMLTLMGLW